MKKVATLIVFLLVFHSLWAQNEVVNLDQAASDSVFVDVGGGVQETSFTVSGNLQTIVFAIAFEEGDPVVQFVSPSGVTLGLDAPGVSVERTEWGMTVGLSAPQLGRWALQLTQTLGAASYYVKTILVPAVPTLTVTTPASVQQSWSSPVAVSGTTQPDQAGKKVLVMLTSSRTQMTGIIAGQTTVNADGSFSYKVDPSEFPQGEYFVVASVDEGDSPSVKAMAPGSLQRPLPPVLTAVPDVVYIVEQPSTLHVSFANPFGRLPATFRVHVLDSTGTEQVVDIGMQTKGRLDGFPSGPAQAWLVGVDSLGREGSPSTKASLTFGSPPVTPPALALAQPTVSANLFVGQAPASLAFSLSGSFASHGPSVDYLEAQIGVVPSGVVLQPVKNQWYLPTDSANLQLQLTVTSIVAPGTYTIPVTFQTVGNAANTVTGTVSLTVVYPPITLFSVSPNEWLVGDDTPVSITGENFFAGTRVLLDGIELAVSSFSTQNIIVEMPDTLSAGAHTLTVQGAEGQNAVTSTLKVVAPNYNLVAYKSNTKALAGTQARFWLGLQPLDGFQGGTQIQLSDLPSGWNAQVDPATATGAQTSVVTVQIPSSATPGDYSLTATTTEGGHVKLIVSVLSATPDPFVSSFSTYTALAGESFYIYGYGFGASPGQIKVDAQTWTVSSWSDDLVKVTVPQGAKSGLLRVSLPNGRISNATTFGVKDYGFQFHTGQIAFQMQGGEKKTVGLQLTGYRQPVDLEVQSSDALLLATLDQISVTPTGLIHLTLSPDKNIPNGTYDVTVRGSSGVYQTSVSFQVVVGSALTFAVKQIPVVLQGTNYAATLSAANSVGTPTFRLAEGVFPQGLTLDPSGLISGRATEAGLFRVVLEVADSAGHKTAQEFKVFVESTGWFTYGRDVDRSWYAPVESPADSRTSWRSPSLGSPSLLLAGANNIYVQTAGGITALYAPKGSFLYTIQGSFAGFQYNRNTLVALGSDGTLHLYETGYGNQIWERSGVARYWAKAGVILADTGTGEVMVLDSSLGTLNGTIAADLSGTLVGWRGKLLRLQGRVLQLWSDTQGWTAAYQDPSVNLVQASGDGKELYLVGQDGSVKSWNGTKATLLWTGAVRSIVVSSDWLAVDTGAAVELRDRTDGHMLRTLPGGGYDELFGAKSKLFAVKGGTLYSINLTTGATIWKTGSAVLQAVLFGDQLYAVDSLGVVTAYNAPDNAVPPVTALVMSPAQADGLNGWFINAPQVSLSATDSETYAASTTWKVDGGSWAPYQGALPLSDGVHTLAWHSVDTGGLQEADKSATVSVDTTRPVTTATTDIAPLAGLPGVWGAPVRVSLSATGASSGVAEIDYRINGGAWQTYSGTPVGFTREGLYTLEYHSQSKAGGWEPVHQMSLNLSFHDPTASADVQKQMNAVFVFLTGTASPVGLDRLEYRLGTAGTVQSYTEAVAFTQTGQWTLYYRAIDIAGRSSTWQSVDIRNQGPDSRDAIGQVTYALGSQGRSIDDSVAVGDLIFSGSTDKFLTLPSQLVGAAYFRNKDTDGQSSSSRLLTVSFVQPVTVYYLQESDSKASMSGWTKGAFLPAGTVSKKYFTGGLQMWSKTFQAGDKATFSGPGLKHAGGDLIFVQAIWNGIQIVAPAPEQDLPPGQTVTFKAYTGMTPSSLKWSVRDVDQDWKVFGTGTTSASYIVSDKDDGGTLSVRVEATVNGSKISTSGDWKVLYQEKLKILFPNPDFPVRTNTPLTPRVVYTDLYNKAQDAPATTWTLSRAGTVLYSGPAPIPIDAVGQYQLSVSAISASGKVLTDSTQFKAVTSWPWVRWHWFEKRHQGWSDSDGQGFYGKGDAQDEDRDSQTKAGKKTLHVWKWGQNAEYRASIPDGTYEVRMILGPFHAWDVHTVTLNNKAINVLAKTEGDVIAVHFTVNVTDGTFHIQGTAGLPFYRFDYRKTDVKTPPSAAVEGRVDSPEDLQ